MVVAVFAVISLASCTGITYHDLYKSVSASEVKLEKANFNVVGTVQGEASATYIFGIGGMSKKALESNAIAELYDNADLKGSQAVINVSTITKAKTYFGGVYAKITYIAHGVVIEFTE